ncbi:MAG: hypothetical protein CHACPFDD_02956 [Phycisphaerae bacterium]|nr:hypothetical protein [Phycisphaerae bacterium]
MSARFVAGLVVVTITAGLAVPARAQSTPATPAFRGDLSLAQEKNGAKKPAAAQPADAKSTAKETTRTETSEGEYHYREISSFFNIREAYANVKQGEWEIESWFEWETKSDGSDDDFGPAFSLKYGITDTIFAELEVETINLGDGGEQGNGELGLQLFWEMWKEAEWYPAMATFVEMRIPSGQGSSGVDAELHFVVTKTLLPNFRGHFEGFIETANGARGGEDEDERRDFQWGVGPGFDYSFSDDTIATVNYLNRCSEEYGHHNQNILEFGVAQKVAEGQHVKAALDVGLDGDDETPNFAAKIQWAIEF